MSINYITLCDAQDFNYILNESFVLTGNVSKQKYEICNNTWAMAFAPPEILSITELDLLNLFNLLRGHIQKQLIDSGSKFCVTFYLWFDEQSGHLCFNVLSGRIKKLPFGCIVKIVPDPLSIIKSCLSSPYLYYIPANEIIEISSVDDDSDDDEIEYILPVYVDYISANK